MVNEYTLNFMRNTGNLVVFNRIVLISAAVAIPKNSSTSNNGYNNRKQANTKTVYPVHASPIATENKKFVSGVMFCILSKLNSLLPDHQTLKKKSKQTMIRIT
jgi:hypothetical protein